MREKERSDELAGVQLARATSYTQAHVFFVRRSLKPLITQASLFRSALPIV